MNWDNTKCAECGAPINAWTEYDYRDEQPYWFLTLVVEPCEVCQARLINSRVNEDQSEASVLRKSKSPDGAALKTN